MEQITMLLGGIVIGFWVSFGLGMYYYWQAIKNKRGKR